MRPMQAPAPSRTQPQPRSESIEQQSGVSLSQHLDERDALLGTYPEFHENSKRPDPASPSPRCITRSYDAHIPQIERCARAATAPGRHATCGASPTARTYAFCTNAIAGGFAARAAANRVDLSMPTGSSTASCVALLLLNEKQHRPKGEARVRTCRHRYASTSGWPSADRPQLRPVHHAFHPGHESHRTAPPLETTDRTERNDRPPLGWRARGRRCAPAAKLARISPAYPTRRPGHHAGQPARDRQHRDRPCSS
jgi:hypothetical protein